MVTDCIQVPFTFVLSGILLKFTCEKYATMADGSTRVVPKNETDCNRLGPLTAGFNEGMSTFSVTFLCSNYMILIKFLARYDFSAACDIFHGKWCPKPRDCSYLVQCINNIKTEVEQSRTRQAFYEYLDEAPNVEFADDLDACGEMRTYFDYDKNYPDDERICDEVRALQVCVKSFPCFSMNNASSTNLTRIPLCLFSASLTLVISMAMQQAHPEQMVEQDWLTLLSVISW